LKRQEQADDDRVEDQEQGDRDVSRPALRRVGKAH